MDGEAAPVLIRAKTTPLESRRVSSMRPIPGRTMLMRLPRISALCPAYDALSWSSLESKVHFYDTTAPAPWFIVIQRAVF